MPRIALLVALSTALVAADRLSAAEPPTRESLDFFENQVRPILTQHCQRCHGAEKQESGLRLDGVRAMVKGGNSGPAIAPGKPDESLLIEAVRHESFEMPPGEKLADEQIAALEKWVRLGAPWPDEVDAEVSTLGNQELFFEQAKSHWSLQPVTKPVVPTVADAAWVQTPIDAFVLARLESEGMRPSPRADKRTLLRRVTYDLTGLPPTEAELLEFEADQSKNAFARVVDRLLDSPAYGERWARHWLDVARYADTRDYLAAGADRTYPFAFTYRDWVIEALNSDLPYDDFVRQQIAADMYTDEPDSPSLAALGYLTVGSRFRNNQLELVADRIDVVTRGLMGLTVSCARCHDHKYDPIPTADYYALYGVFASTEDPADYPIIAGSKPSDELLQDYQRHRAEREAELEDWRTELRDTARADFRRRVLDYLDAYYAMGIANKESVRSLVSKHELSELVIDPMVNSLNRLKVDRRRLSDPVWGPWATLVRGKEAEFVAERDALLAGQATPRGNTPRYNAAVVEMLRSQQPRNVQQMISGYGRLFAQAVGPVEAGSQESAGKPAARRAKAAIEPVVGSLDDTSRAELLAAIDDEQGVFGFPKDDVMRASQVFGQARTKLASLRGAITKLEASHPGAPARAMVLVDKEKPVDPVIMLRGDPRRRGDGVSRRFLAVLGGRDDQPFTHGSGRRELAEAIVDPANPLTPRVAVNRVWRHHFGQGLCDTPGDFGFRSPPPSHPELLDWLAATFVEQGWSLKALHRLILLSNTYQQASATQPEFAQRDPENRLLWRANRRRLDFESMRDSMLAVSGQLDPSVGGRAVPLTSEPFTTRRTIYGFIDRLNLDPIFSTFDFASPEASAPERPETVVPQQALFGMNHPFVIAQARNLCATELFRRADDVPGRVEALYRQVFGRRPTPREINMTRRYVDTAAAEPALAPGVAWQYGWGPSDLSIAAHERFHPFEFFTGQEYRLGAEFPDPKLGHLRLTATGGTPGRDLDHAVIRRWVAPRAATVEITGKLSHLRDNGDGIRAQIVAEHGGVLGSWTVFNQEQETHVARYRVKAGEAIDFIVDCRERSASDAHTWSPTIRVLGEAASGATVMEWNARGDFAAPPPPPLSPWEQVAQALLLTNEFLYLD